MKLSSNVSLTQLEYAAALARLGGFGKAAAQCGVSQPALSVQIQRLEAAIGGPLFDRLRQPVVPTELGEVVVAQARVILREARRLDDLADMARGRLTGELRVGVIPTLAPYLLPRFLPDFVRREAGLTVVIEELQTPQIIRQLRDEQLDAGLIASCPPGDGFSARALFDEPFLGYLPARHRLARAKNLDIRSVPPGELLLLAEGHCLREQILDLCGGGPPAPAEAGALNFAGGNLETLKGLVERGAGVTLLPALAAIGRRGNGGAVLRPLRAPSPRRTVYLARHRVHLKARPIEAFVQALLDRLPDSVRLAPSAS